MSEEKALFGTFHTIDDLLASAAPVFQHSVGVLLSHVNGDGSGVLAGMQEYGNTLVTPSSSIDTNHTGLFGAYGEYCALTHNTLTIALHRMAEDHHDLIVTIGPAVTKMIEQIQKRSSLSLPPIVSVGGYLNTPLHMAYTGYNPSRFVTELTNRFPEVVRPYLVYSDLLRHSQWFDSIYTPTQSLLEQHGIQPYVGTATGAHDVIATMPSDADAVIILPHDALIDIHMQLIGFSEQTNIPLLICSHDAVYRGGAAFSYAPDMRTIGRTAGKHIASILSSSQKHQNISISSQYFCTTQKT